MDGGSNDSISNGDNINNDTSDDTSSSSTDGISFDDVSNDNDSNNNSDEKSESIDYSDKYYHDMEQLLDKKLNKFNPRDKNFLIKLIDYIENFKLSTFKKDVEKKKDESKQKKENEEKLKEAGKTVSDINKQRDTFIGKVMMRALLFGLAGTFIVSAFILARQNNESFNRKVLHTKKMINDAASFGSIGDKDYFMEQNVLNDKIDIVQKSSEKSIKILEENMKKQTALIKEHISIVVGKSENERKKSDNINLNKITQIIDKKIKKLDDKQTLQLEKLSNKIESNSKKIASGIYVRNSGDGSNKNRKRPQLDFGSGEVIFLSGNKATTIDGDYNASSEDSNSSSEDDSSNIYSNNSSDNNSSDDSKIAKKNQHNRYYPRRKIILIEDEYEMVEEEFNVAPSSEETLSVSTLYDDVNSNKRGKFQPFEVDLTTALVRATLLTGVRAATLDIGVANPSPVLLSLEGTVHLSNDYVTDLRGCFLRATAIGNINTSKAEIFGTNLSCVIVAEDGKKYKIDHTFANNEVWIKGEDGNDGVGGVIVDSSGKILAKSAAIGFAQGLSSYFSAQTAPTGIIGSSVDATNPTLKASVQSGTASAMTKSFELVVAQYEKILNGYYPYIDVKGGRKNLTVFFGGSVKLTVEEFDDPSLETMIHNNMARGYNGNKDDIAQAPFIGVE